MTKKSETIRNASNEDGIDTNCFEVQLTFYLFQSFSHYSPLFY